MKNFDRFHIMTGLILSLLYEDLPFRITIDFDEICEFLLTREDPDVMPWQDTYCATVNWLSDEGYIHSDCKETNGLCFKIKPTSKCLNGLQKFTETKDPKVIGEVLVEAADAGNLEKLRLYGRAALTFSSKAS